MCRGWQASGGRRRRIDDGRLLISARQRQRGQSGTITAVVNALAKAGIELGENGSIFPRPKGKPG